MDYDELRAAARLAVKPLRPVSPEVSLKRLARDTGISLDVLERRIERKISTEKCREAHSEGAVRVVKPLEDRIKQSLMISSAIENLDSRHRLVIRKINAYTPYGTANEMFKRGGLIKCRVHEGEERLTPRGLILKRWREYEGGEWVYGTDFVRPAGGNFQVFHAIDIAMGQLLNAAGLIEVSDYTSAGSAYVHIPAFGNRPMHNIMIRSIVTCKGKPTNEQLAEAYGYHTLDGCGKVSNFANKKNRTMPPKFDPTGLYPRQDRTTREDCIDYHGIGGHFAVSDLGERVIPVFPKLSKRELLFLAKAAQYVLVEDPRSLPGENLYARLSSCSQANLEQLFYDFRAYQSKVTNRPVRASLIHDGKSGLWSMLTAP